MGKFGMFSEVHPALLVMANFSRSSSRIKAGQADCHPAADRGDARRANTGPRRAGEASPLAECSV